jgi:26S proteasome regulatory subunit T6
MCCLHFTTPDAFHSQVDSIGSSRGDSGAGRGDSEVQRTMLELLNQLDGFEASSNIKIMMATNRLDILDEALIRPGRIDRRIEVPHPNEKSRLEIMRIHSRKMNMTRGCFPHYPLYGSFAYSVFQASI